jgi:hypothetical protein
MGHIRIGRLPKNRKWAQVLDLLYAGDSSSADIAAATAKAAKNFFSEKGTDPSLVFAYWILTQITGHSRTNEFKNELKKIGLDITNVSSALDFLANISDFINSQLRLRDETFPISEFAQLSFREVLTETIGQRCKTLFGTTIEDIRLSCRNFSSPDQFAKISRLYFSKVLNRCLQFVVSKETPNRIGGGEKFKDIFELSDFNQALETYCFQSAKIVEKFAGGWYSKRRWLGEISETETKGFVFIAMDKLWKEIAREVPVGGDED